MIKTFALTIYVCIFPDGYYRHSFIFMFLLSSLRSLRLFLNDSVSRALHYSTWNLQRQYNHIMYNNNYCALKCLPLAARFRLSLKRHNRDLTRRY